MHMGGASGRGQWSFIICQLDGRGVLRVLNPAAKRRRSTAAGFNPRYAIPKSSPSPDGTKVIHAVSLISGAGQDSALNRQEAGNNSQQFLRRNLEKFLEARESGRRRWIGRTYALPGRGLVI
jgi:hypothetical protein